MENVVLEPPLYFAKDHIFDVCFHPSRDVLVASIITGEVNILGYNSDDVTELASLTHHKESCRQSFFSDDGNVLVTVSKDKSYALVDQNGKLQVQVKKAHEDALNCGYMLNNETLATGDDSGEIKIWDLRNPYKPIFDVKEQDEVVTDMVSTENNHYLLSTSQDGSLAVYDLRKSNDSDAKLLALSDCMEEDLMSVCLIKNEQFVACSTSEGAILLFKWDYFGDFKDRVLGHPNSIDSMIKYDENTLISGSEDGFARAVSIYPNDIIATLGQHEEDEQFPISKLTMSHCKNFLASCSHDSSIKFYDISHLKKMRQNANVMDLNELSDDEEIEDEDDMEEEKSNNNNKNKKMTKHQLQKKQQMQDEFSDDSDDFEDEDSDEDDEDSFEQNKNKKEKKYQRVMKGKKVNLKQRNSEVQKQKRMDFFGNM